MTNLIEKKKWTERKLKTIGYQKYWLSQIETARDKLEMAKEYEIDLKPFESELALTENMFEIETRIKNALDKLTHSQ